MDEMLAAALKDLGESYQAGMKGQADRIEEITARLDDIELASQRPGYGSDRRTPQDRAFASYLRHGKDGMEDADRQNLIISDDTQGGYLKSPDLFIQQILKGLEKNNPVRQYARVVQVSSGGATIPLQGSEPTAYWVGETEQRQETTWTYGRKNIAVHEVAAFADVSQQLVEDAAFNIEGEVATELAKAFRKVESSALTVGDGFQKPFGFLTDTDIENAPSGHASQITADALIDMYHALPTEYAANAIWGMNRSTMAKVRKLKTGDGEYLWERSIQSGNPPSILGRPVIEFPTLGNVEASARPIVFADFSGYLLLDRVNFGLLRDPLTQATRGMVRYVARRRVGGAVIEPEKFITMKIGTSV